MIKLPLPPHEMTQEQIRQHVLDTDARQIRELPAWLRTHRTLIGERLRKQLPVPQEVAAEYLNNSLPRRRRKQG